MDSENYNLIEQIAEGNNQVIKQLYDDYFHYVTAFVCKNGGEMHDQKEVFQEALVALYLAAQNPKFKIKTHIKHYLAGIVRNLWINELGERKQTNTIKKIKTDDSIVDFSDDYHKIVEEKIQLESQYDKMVVALEEIGDNCKTLINYSFFEKLKDKEIAPLMNYTVEFVKQKRSRCLKRLQKIASKL